MQQRQWVDQDRAESESLRVDQASRGYWRMAVEDALEMLIEVLDRLRAQGVEDAPHFDTRIRVGISPVTCPATLKHRRS